MPTRVEKGEIWWVECVRLSVKMEDSGFDLVDWRWWRCGFGRGGSGVEVVAVLVRGGGGLELVAVLVGGSGGGGLELVAVWVRWRCSVEEERRDEQWKLFC
ncbi:hypothetical protein LWI28_026777 [Acer negundo]|uniref:Uncharacterized protein n=1 Tax=Acer negundo TaxID=4023 RepID=A0AAD5NKT0_ACENE|nr:hypothetical protein LWI28_026777 [Acer negundo]